MAIAVAKRGDSSDQSTDTTLAVFLRELAKAERKHGDRVKRYEDADDAYNATLKPGDDVEDEWRSTLHPPYIFETVQTLKAMVVDDRPIASVQPPKGKPDCKDKAQAYENVLNDQRDDDDYDRKFDEYVLQGLQRGLTVAKVAWEVRSAKVRQQSLTPVYGSVLPDRTVDEVEKTIVNRPTLIVCDVKDVMWDPAATSADTITTLFYRTYETKSSLKALEADGVYQNTADLAPNGQQGTGSPGARDLKDRVEVIERWKRTADGITLTTVANRNTVIRDEEPSPFIHQELPFVFCAPTPMLFKVEGKSEPELIADSQTLYWQVQNQTIDNIELINNTVIFPDESEPDVADWRIRPGAINPKQSARPLEFWNPPASIVEPAFQLLEKIKGDMQDISAASPYVSGADSEGIDNKTATGISLVQNMATKRILLKKQRFADAERQIGRQQLQLNEQLAPDILPAYGPNGEPVPLRIADIIGCTYEVEDASESLNRQERRSEATLMMQTAGALMVLPQFANVFNARALAERYVEAFDEDPEQLLMPDVPMGMPMAPGAVPGGPMAGGVASPVSPGGGLPAAMPTTPPFGAGAAGSTPPFSRLPQLGGQAA